MELIYNPEQLRGLDAEKWMVIFNRQVKPAIDAWEAEANTRGSFVMGPADFDVRGHLEVSLDWD